MKQGAHSLPSHKSPVPRRMNSAAAAQVEDQQHFTMPASKLRALEILIEHLK